MGEEMPKISEELERAIARRLIDDQSSTLNEIGAEFHVGWRVVARIRRLPYVARAFQRRPTRVELRAKLARWEALPQGKRYSEGDASDLRLKLRGADDTDKVGDAARARRLNQSIEKEKRERSAAYALRRQPRFPGGLLIAAWKAACKAYVAPQLENGDKLYYRYLRARSLWEEWRDANKLPEPAGGLRLRSPTETSTPAALGILD